MNRVGIFGGSFDPPHNAHLEIARLATDQIPLDRLYFVPCFEAPLKSHPPLASSAHRLAMVELLVHDRPEWQVLAFEINQQREVPTVETVTYLQGIEPQADLYLIIGGDQAEQFQQWQQFEALIKMARIVCFSRPGTLPAAGVADKLQIIPFEMSLSSSQLREQIKAGGNPHALLPPAILTYIQERQLYR